jgi:hypothetical protein
MRSRQPLVISARFMIAVLAALDPPQRREVAEELWTMAETFAGMPDGRHTAHTLRMLALLPRGQTARLMVSLTALGRGG